ncbi:type III pantothenate kinase [Dissulfurispira thermophila]|uniref:type III pantothenate kinase n=1 Tax=Dissulfurispira thermophila TaxID=2715679 RepID=UPI00193E06F0|nr:type III pantothenate kinase [Dissulfurispira thermophila]
MAIDIGNSTIGFCIFQNPKKNKKMFIKRISTHPALSAKIYKEIIAEIIGQRTKSKDFDTIISSVVPSINVPIVEAVKDICRKKPILVNHKIDCGLTFDVKTPEKIGADRIANAIAGFYYYKRPVAVVDMGTATTITIVSIKKPCKHPVFLGGAIMPGINLMHRSLHTWTAKLPHAPIKTPNAVLGKDTTSSINSGIINGTAGAIEALIKGVEKELGFRLKLILTGGYAKLVSPLIKKGHSMVPNLTFEGLRLIYLYMSGTALCT